MQPPPPPPRDPSGINNIVEKHHRHRDEDYEEAMSSDGSSDAQQKRRSSYENIHAEERFLTNKPPSLNRRSRESSLIRSTPSPSVRPPSSCRRASPVGPCRQDSWSDDGERRRPSSACGRMSRRGDCPASPWSHRSNPCCTPMHTPYHFCGAHFLHAGNEMSCEDLEQRISHLEIEKHQLALQVNVLSDQVEAQNEKAEELEYLLEQSKEQLTQSEILLKKEMACRSAVEKSRLELMSQISALRLRIASVENDKRETEERNCKLENELILTCACLAEKEAEMSTFKSSRGGIIESKNTEFEKLRGALSSVLELNEEKEREIQEMKSSFNRYKRLQELVLSNSSKKKNDSTKLLSVEENFLSANSLFTDIMSNSMYECSLSEKPPSVPRHDDHRLSPLFTPDRSSSQSRENINPPTPQKTPPMKRYYSTLPRPHQADILKQFVKNIPENTTTNTTGASSSVHNLHHLGVVTPPKPTFSKGFFKMRLRCSSAPELAPDKIETHDVNCNFRSTTQPKKKTTKGLRKIFGKVRRNGSENLNSSTAELKRGGIRATAGPRLGWSENLKLCNSSFNAEWNNSMICDWLISIGLSMYLQDCKKWGKDGEHLVKYTTTDFEKELNIKNALHRKKLLLCLKGDEVAGKIDYQWVVRWLDDIGLPQYKDAFYEARMDGRMLHHLTLDDLSQLKVSNLLHHLSIKRGIEVLRENKFDPLCLRRRSLPDEGVNEVSRWTNHRVMEWLRNVDLSEYAPNLRGSGVHGGLMMYEHRFNADLMATLLNIPPSKTLLRRHLTTQFRLLVGPDALQKKRECETKSDFVPLSISAKVKSVKRVFSRKRIDEYVCPLKLDEMLNENRTEEEKFLMKEMVLKNDTVLEKMPASNV